jgi:4-hydroxy-tetrahydrodipicolinate reductase
MVALAILGTGKTGRYFLPPHNQQWVDPLDTIEGFNRTHTPNKTNLSQCDVVIVFIPGEDVLKSHLIDLLLEIKKPVVWGSTGLNWESIQASIHNQLIQNHTTWIRSHNFALGMMLIKPLIETFYKQASSLFTQKEWLIEETHHIHKKDGPSGTALLWKKWFEQSCSETETNPLTVTFKREGDEIGKHQLILKTPLEQITIEHQALDRSLFAFGAYQVAKRLLQKNTPHGFFELDQLWTNQTANKDN